jgi:hypothetical protein
MLGRSHQSKPIGHRSEGFSALHAVLSKPLSEEISNCRYKRSSSGQEDTINLHRRDSRFLHEVLQTPFYPRELGRDPLFELRTSHLRAQMEEIRIENKFRL